MARTTSCFAIGCRERIPISRFGCRKHWFALPKPFRDEVWRAYKAGDRDRTLELARDAMKLLQGTE